MAKEKNTTKIQNFRVSLMDDASHKQIWVRKYTRTGLWITIISIIVSFAIAFFCLIAFTPVRTIIPGYPNSETRMTAIQNALKIDSLERIVYRWELYSENLERIVNGEEPIKIDSILNVTNKVQEGDVDITSIAASDSLLRQTVTEAEQFDLNANAQRDLSIEGVHFFTPIKGVVSQGFDAALHPYIDITAPAGSVVMSILDGTVIFAGWSNETGYTMQIQHSGDLISVYKHNQTLLKQQGDKVSAGSSIALLGNTGTLTTGDHLHFELWYKGEAVDPTKYISF